MRGRRDQASSYNGTVLSSVFPAGRQTGEHFFLKWRVNWRQGNVLNCIESKYVNMNLWMIFQYYWLPVELLGDDMNILSHHFTKFYCSN